MRLLRCARVTAGGAGPIAAQKAFWQNEAISSFGKNEPIHAFWKAWLRFKRRAGCSRSWASGRPQLMSAAGNEARHSGASEGIARAGSAGAPDGSRGHFRFWQKRTHSRDRRGAAVVQEAGITQSPLANALRCPRFQGRRRPRPPRSPAAGRRNARSPWWRPVRSPARRYSRSRRRSREGRH